jgi:hypothetical protein
MVFSKCLGSFALLATAVLGKEMAVNQALAEQMYDSGIVHESIMTKKMSTWTAEREAGVMESTQYPELGYTACKNGVAEAIPGDANNTFRCSNVSIHIK